MNKYGIVDRVGGEGNQPEDSAARKILPSSCPPSPAKPTLEAGRWDEKLKMDRSAIKVLIAPQSLVGAQRGSLRHKQGAMTNRLAELFMRRNGLNWQWLFISLDG
jgi:hypothetical protein